MTVSKSQFKKLVKINKLAECMKLEIYEVKKIGNLDAKKLARSDKMWNVGTSEKASTKMSIVKHKNTQMAQFEAKLPFIL